VKALVTGGGGFLGRSLVEHLVRRGDQVRALCRGGYPEVTALGAEIVRADLRDRPAVAAACRGMDVVFHAAGVAGLGVRWHDYHAVNTLGTSHVIEGCRAAGVGRLVLTSSPSVTFDGSDQRGVDESAPYPKRWLCPYQHTKALAEQDVLRANDPGRLLTCALRPHLIWGERDRHLIPRLLDRARRGRLRRVGDGTNLIDTIYVDNAAAAHLQAADALLPGAPLAGRAYFLSQGEPVNCWQWIDQILALAGLPPVRRSISLAAAWRIGRAMELLYGSLRLAGEPPMTRFLAAQLATSHYYDISRARRDFGYQPQVSTAEGMVRLKEFLKLVVGG
jgi:nucleoside-diphosphate-sugar epimerase